MRTNVAILLIIIIIIIISRKSGSDAIPVGKNSYTLPVFPNYLMVKR
jgi:hypothetical protein